MRFIRGAVIADWKLFPIPRKTAWNTAGFAIFDGPYVDPIINWEVTSHKFSRRWWDVRERSGGGLVMNCVFTQVDLRFFEIWCNTLCNTISAISANMADEEEESSLELTIQRHKKEAKELQGILHSWYLIFECCWCILLFEFLLFPRSLHTAKHIFASLNNCTWVDLHRFFLFLFSSS